MTENKNQKRWKINLREILSNFLCILYHLRYYNMKIYILKNNPMLSYKSLEIDLISFSLIRFIHCSLNH